MGNSEFDELIHKVNEDFFRFDCLYGELAKMLGETYLSLMTLEILGEHPQGISQKALGRQLFLSKQTMNSVIRGFEQRGLVSHKVDEADKRSKLHCLTEEGQRHHDKLMAIMRRIDLQSAKAVGLERLQAWHETSVNYMDAYEKELKNLSTETNDHAEKQDQKQNR